MAFHSIILKALAGLLQPGQKNAQKANQSLKNGSARVGRRRGLEGKIFSRLVIFAENHLHTFHNTG